MRPAYRLQWDKKLLLALSIVFRNTTGVSSVLLLRKLKKVCVWACVDVKKHVMKCQPIIKMQLLHPTTIIRYSLPQ